MATWKVTQEANAALVGDAAIRAANASLNNNYAIHCASAPDIGSQTFIFQLASQPPRHPQRNAALRIADVLRTSMQTALRQRLMHTGRIAFTAHPVAMKVQFASLPVTRNSIATLRTGPTPTQHSGVTRFQRRKTGRAHEHSAIDQEDQDIALSLIHI